MTDHLQFESSAIFANVADRTLRLLLLPWNELSRQSPTTAPIRFARGRVKVPRDVSIVGANIDHDHFSPVGRAARVENQDQGLVGVFKIADTDEGDALLLKADEAEKAGQPLKVSPELRNIFREGEEGLSAELIGAGFVGEGAWASAAVFSLAVTEDQTTETDNEKIARLERELAAARPATDDVAPQTPDPAPADPADTPAPPAPNQEDKPMGQPLGNRNTDPGAGPKPVSLNEAIGIFNAIRRGDVSEEQLKRLRPTLHTGGENGVFALNDVKYDGSNSVQPDERRPTWVGELWKGLTYQQVVIPLFVHADLRSKKVAGFRWTTQPAGATWNGNKANIPSNQPVTAPDDVTAGFWAMGHDHAIEHEIFDTPGYFESYFAAGRESYALWADTKALTDLLAEADDIEADDPTGLDIGAGWSALIDGAVQVIENGALPTFSLIATQLYKSMLKTPAKDILGYLDAQLGLDKGTLADAGFVIRAHSAITAGHVLVGARQAATVYELPDLIKVTAPDTVKGGIDTNMIGAEATFVHKADALVDVAPFDDES